MSSLLARFPRLAAWIVTLLLLSGVTFGAISGLRLLSQGRPPGLHHAHGTIVAIRGDSFELKETGPAGKATLEWFRLATGAPISMEHLLRHMREAAATDVTYMVGPGETCLAWTAD